MLDAAAKRHTQLDQQSNKIAPYRSQDSYTDVFSTMCSSLLEIVTGRKVIQDRYLLEFSRLVVQMISNAIETLPDSFNKLLAAILQYLRDSMWNDADQNRKTSYIRAHQIASILDVYCTEQKHEELMRQEWKANWQNRYLLCYIFQSPGIALSELQEKLKLSRSELSRWIRQLEEKKLLSSHQSSYDDEPYYMLSRLGMDVCQNLLEPRIHYVMPNQWSRERVYLLNILLKTQLEASDDTIPVMTYVRKVSALREVDVQYFVSKVRPNAESHAVTVSFVRVPTEPYRIRSAAQSLRKGLEREAFGVDGADEAYDMVVKEEYRDERYFRKKKKAELLRKIKWAQERLQRICVCVDAYRIINSIEPADQPAFFRWFLETADDIWFTNPPQEQDDPSVRNKALSKMFGEADAAKLLKLLNDPAGMSDEQSDPDGHPIPPDASLTTADTIRCHAKYTRSVTGLVDQYSNENYPAQEYYHLLLTALDSLLSDCTAEEKGVCLYTILIDKRTPYQEVGKGLCMSSDDYRHILESIRPSIQKMRYILALRNTYQTEPASQLLSVLESLQSNEEKTAFLCALMNELRPGEEG